MGRFIVEISKEVLKGYIDTLILSVLKNGDCYGYQIAKDVKYISSNTLLLKEGTMYLSLKRLEGKDFIESYWGEEQGAGGRRRYYKLTKNGIEALEYKKNEWRALRNIMDLFLGRND